jgi:hypothetical protein
MRLLLRVWAPTGDLLLTDGVAVTLQDRETQETLRFVPGLEIDEAALSDSLAWLSDSLVPRSLSVTVLRAGGIVVDGLAEVSRLLDDSDDHADRQIIASGVLRDIVADLHWWQATVVEDTDDDRGQLLDDNAAVSDATWPRTDAQRAADGSPAYFGSPQNYDARIDGAVYPVPIGIPSVQGIASAGTVYDDAAVSGPLMLVEYAGIALSDMSLLVAGAPVAATHVRHISENASGAYGERLPVQRVHDMQGRPVSIVTPATAVTVDAEHWCCWSADDGGGIADPYGPGILRRFDHVIRWALDRSTLRIARRELPRLGALSSLMVDTLLTAQARPWDWLRSQVLPLVPVSVATGPDGLYLWPWIPALQTLDCELSLHIGVDCERVGPWQRPALDMVSRVTVAYGLEGRGGNLVKRHTLCGRRRSTDPLGTTALDYWARRARDLVGERSLQIDAPIICDDATAQMVARYALQARCRPQMLTTLQVQRDDRLRPGALVRVIESALSLDVVAEVSAVRYTGDESLTITVRHWAQQGKEQNYA